MAYGDAVSKPYAAGVGTDSLAARDLGRTAVGGLTPMVQEVTHEITAGVTLAPVVVTTAGTRVRLNGSSLLVRIVALQALPNNGGIVVVGDASVIAAAATRRGIALPTAGSDWFTFPFNDLTNIWLDATVNGDGVSVLYFT